MPPPFPQRRNHVNSGQEQSQAGSPGRENNPDQPHYSKLPRLDMMELREVYKVIEKALDRKKK